MCVVLCVPPLVYYVNCMRLCVCVLCVCLSWYMYMYMILYVYNILLILCEVCVCMCTWVLCGGGRVVCVREIL